MWCPGRARAEFFSSGVEIFLALDRSLFNRMQCGKGQHCRRPKPSGNNSPYPCLATKASLCGRKWNANTANSGYPFFNSGRSPSPQIPILPCFVWFATRNTIPSIQPGCFVNNPRGVLASSRNGPTAASPHWPTTSFADKLRAAYSSIPYDGVDGSYSTASAANIPLGTKFSSAAAASAS